MPRAIAAAREVDVHDLDPAILGTARFGDLASRVAVIPEVRQALSRSYPRFRASPRRCRAGISRDIGTRIAPEADVKLFIEATARPGWNAGPASLRRGPPVDRYALYHQIEQRDARDRANPNGAFIRFLDRPLAGHHTVGYRGGTPRCRRHCRRGYGAQGRAQTLIKPLRFRPFAISKGRRRTSINIWARAPAHRIVLPLGRRWGSSRSHQPPGAIGDEFGYANCNERRLRIPAHGFVE